MSLKCVKKILYIHGLESGPNGTKPSILRNYFEVSVPHMKHPYNIWQSMNLIIDNIYVFRPDIIVASSYGTIIAMLLMQFGVWTGPTLLLSTAMELFNHYRSWIPPQVSVLVIHGDHDTLCPTPRFTHRLIGDDHKLKSICEGENPLLISYVQELSNNSFSSENSDCTQVNKPIIHPVSKFIIFIKLIYVIIEALFLQFLNLCDN